MHFIDGLLSVLWLMFWPISALFPEPEAIHDDVPWAKRLAYALVGLTVLVILTFVVLRSFGIQL